MELIDLINKGEVLVKIEDGYYGLEPKLDFETIVEEEKEDIHIPMHLLGNLDIISKGDKKEGRRVIAGYASVIEIDQQDQIIPQETLQEGIETLLKDSGYANLMLVHQNIQIGKIIDKFGELVTRVSEKGLFIIAEIRKDLEIANEIWSHILDKELNGFSIAGEVMLSHEVCDDTKCVTVIDKMNIFEISICSEPVNEKSGFVVISKSNIDVCEDLENEGKDEMTKKSKKQPTKAKSEKVEEPCEDCKEETIEEKAEESVEEVTEEKSEDVVEEVVEEKSEPELAMKDIIENLSKEIEHIKNVIEELKAVPEEEDEEDEELEEKSEETPEPTETEVVEEAVEEPIEEVVEEKSEEEPVVEVQYASKEDFDNLKASIDDMANKLSILDEIEELKISIKSKDDQILELTKRLEVVEKTEDKPKVKAEGVKVVTASKTKLVRDPLRPGTYYREND